MKTLQELLQDRAALVGQQEALYQAGKAAGKFTDEQKTQFDQLDGQIAELDQEIAARQQFEQIGQKVAGRVAALDQPLNQPRRPQIEVGKNRATERPWDEHGRGTNYAAGMFLRAVMAAAEPGAQPSDWDPRLKWRAAATGMGVSTPSDGGFLFEPTVATELISNGYALSQLAPRCRKVPIGEMSSGLSVNVVDETSRATGSRWGGVQMYWRNEGDTVTASKPKLRKLDVPLESLMGLMYATRESMKDPVQTGAIFRQAFSEEIAWMLDNAIIRGTGVGSPLGLVNAAARIEVAKETNQKATTIVAQNVLKMMQRLWPRSLNNAVWLYNQNAFVQLATMTLDVGTGGVPVWMPAGGVSGKPFMTLMGMQMLPMEQCSTLGTVGDLILVDLNEFVLIEQDDPEIAESIHVRFINGENTFRIMYDVNGRPYWTSAITPANGSETLSPYVMLAARS